MANELKLGETRTGLLIDGISDTPLVACSITYESLRGPVVSVPYVDDDPQFDLVRQWFADHSVPNTLIFQDANGTLLLNDLHWRGRSGHKYMLERFDVAITVFGRPVRVKRSYSIREMRSWIDGLDVFAQFTSFKSEFDRSAAGLKTIVTINPKDKLACRHGGFTYSLDADAPWSDDGHEFTVNSETSIRTQKAKGATTQEHLTAQWPIRALLIMATGGKIYSRKHQLKDKQFPMLMLSGENKGPFWVDALLGSTLRDVEQPPVKRQDIGRPMFYLADLGSSGLRRWLELYKNEEFRRAIEPTVETLNGASGFLESRILLTILGLDAMGFYLDPQRTKKVPLKQQIERCLIAAQVDWSVLGDTSRIAFTMANINNDVKHPDRLDRPDSLSMWLIANLALVIMRLQLFHLLKLPDRRRDSFFQSNDARRAIEAFRLNGVTFGTDGKLVH